MSKSAMASNSAFDEAARALRADRTPGAGGRLDARELVRNATLAASSHNTQPWLFRIEGDAIAILPDFSRRCPQADPDDAHLYKSLGCAAENIVHAAAAQGFSAGIRFDAEGDRVLVSLRPEPSARATELYQAISRRQCVRLPYEGTPVAAADLDVLRHAGAGDGVRALMVLSAEHKADVIDFVTQGNLAQLSDRAFRDELVSWIRFNPREAMLTGDGLSGRVSGQPAVPTWLATRIAALVLAPKRQAATDAANIESSAGLAVFVSRRNDRAAWVETGRACQRFALRATALDIRTAFINQPIEVPAVRSRFESWLGLEGEHALLMMRFGHGPTAPFSLRRPLEEVIVAG